MHGNEATVMSIVSDGGLHALISAGETKGNDLRFAAIRRSFEVCV